MPKPPRKPQPGRTRSPGKGRPAGPPAGKSRHPGNRAGKPAGARTEFRGKAEAGPGEHKPQESEPAKQGNGHGKAKGSFKPRKQARPGAGKAGPGTQGSRPHSGGKRGQDASPGSRPPRSKPQAASKPAQGERRPGPRSRPIQSKRPEANGTRLTADQARDLPRQWIREIEQTSREATGPAVATAVAEALEALADENFEAAAKSAAQAKSNAPRSAMIQEIYGLSLYHLGRWKEALTELMSYRRISGARDQNHVIADCYRALDRPEKASEICAEVDKGDVPPDVWAETMIVAAGALADRGDLGRALRTLARAELEPAAVEPFHLRLWYVRADLLEKMGRDADAMQLWQRIVAEDPEFFDAEERLQSSR